ncbi:hypothetical protein [Rummeliibacillus sp. TYF-LIM-RU47]|uniref:hypothetical protein n=1 Tax=Rummeliibacillus sp. TYF-LIM-RU47 TaxID=2608406 RepID=UPI00123A4978|nr:hypothetical protein [Rummeliibacillus sp. TYF-LIM-RU47]
MNQDDIRQSIQDAKTNEMGVGFVGVEMFIISVALGIIFSSWWIFGIVLIGSFILFNIEYTAKILLLILTLAWGVIAYKIGHVFGISAAIVLGALALLFAGGIHFSAFGGFRDMK